MTYLVTGAAGSVGTHLVARLDDVVATDLDDLDVTNPVQVSRWVNKVKPDVIFHLAGAKHAPAGETDPAQVARVNIDGTLYVLAAAEHAGAQVVLASTCKACDPETAYGATKLIAERATLNQGGVIVRFHNIPESSGNVFRIWEQTPAHEPLCITDCWRYFTPMDKAVDLLLEAPNLPSGRYAVDPGLPRHIPEVAAQLYPGRKLRKIDRRRGDRDIEPLIARCETIVSRENGIMVIRGAHDPEAAWTTPLAA